MVYKILLSGTIEEILDVLSYIRNHKPNVKAENVTETAGPVHGNETNPGNVCPECKEVFYGNKKFCSMKCYNRAYYRTNQGKKLTEIRKTCPAPKPRPTFTRDNQ